MPQLDIELLSQVVVQIPQHSELTPAERSEVLRIAQG